MADPSSKVRRFRSGFLLLAVLAFAVTACNPSAPMSTIAPDSDFAKSILDLYSLLFWLSVVVFVLVEGILIYSVVRFRQRPGQGLPPQVHGNTRLEIAWTIVPAIILVVIAIPTLTTIFKYQNAAPDPDITVNVIGHQWWWEFEYPELGIVTANEPHMPLNKTVQFHVESADVIHSFWFPRLGGKQDVNPNHPAQLWFTPTVAGEFYGQCAEYCGTQHANMKLRGFVDEQTDFDAWVQQQQSPAVTPQSGSAEAQGHDVFLRSACVGCHTIKGTPANGKIGPDLTHFGSRSTLASGMIDNNPENLRRWIANPQEVKPGNKMPQIPLNDQDLDAVVAYLTSLK